jgi:hypothetical protein
MPENGDRGVADRGEISVVLLIFLAIIFLGLSLPFFQFINDSGISPRCIPLEEKFHRSDWMNKLVRTTWNERLRYVVITQLFLLLVAVALIFGVMINYLK